MQMQTLSPTTPRGIVHLLALALLASLWLAPQAALAQPSPEQMQQRMAAQTDTLIQKLSLKDDQKAPVRAILEEHNTKRMDLFTKARESGSFQDMRESMATLNEETEAKLAKVLTAEQMETYRKVQEELAEQRRQRRGM